MSDPRFARAVISQLREQLHELADEVGPYADLPEPTARLPHDRFDSATGAVWEITAPNPLGVIALDDEPGVFVEGHGWSYGGDWYALRTSTARHFALALLAAADWSDRKHSRSGPEEVQA